MMIPPTIRNTLKFFLIIIALHCTQVSYAQFYTYGQDPASQKWRQIRTENFRFIYPENWEDQTQELAHFFESIRDSMNRPLNSHPKPIPIVLRNQSMLSNGFVMWAPKRVEMVTTTPYDNMAVKWMKYLSIHEYRHVVQIEAANVSTTGFLAKIFGQAVTGSVAGLHLPLWFLEGDAVLSETSMTQAGRGRLPSFIMPLTAQLLEKGKYSYDKAILGSYRDMVPNHYTLGYHIVGATVNKYGFEPFQQATRRAGVTPFLPGSFSRGVKKATGMNLSELYQEVIGELKETWDLSYTQTQVSEYTIIEPDNNFDYVSYINPQYIDDDQFIAFRTTPQDIPRLVKIGRDGSEEILFTPGFGYLISMSYANGIVAWAEISRDPRWGYRVWTNLRIFELETGKSRPITQRSRLQSPMLSPDGSQIAAIEVDDLNQWALLIIDTQTGEEVYRIADNSIDFMAYPAWTDQGDGIVAIAFVENKGKSIVRLIFDNPEFEFLYNAGFTEINRPVVHADAIYFTGTWAGKDDLYKWNISESQLSRVVSSSFGATHASVSSDGSKILFSDYVNKGFRLGEIMLEPPQAFVIEQAENQLIPLFDSAARVHNLLADTITLSGEKFESKRYRKFPNAFHFHSWVPASLDVDNYSVNPGVTLFSQDLLGTTVISGGYNYDSQNNGHSGFIDLSLRAIYPVFDLRFEAGAEDRLYRTRDNSTITLRTDYGKLIAAVSLPLVFYHNSLIYGLIPRVSTSQEIYSFNFQDSTYRRGSRPLSYIYSMYGYQRMAFRDIFPKWGITFTAGYSHTPFSSTESFTDLNSGEILFGAAIAYLPGLFKHHSFRIYAGHQQRVIKDAYFSDRIRFARGYDSQFNDQLTTYTASYTLPVAYPDFNLGSLIYTKRITANLFADHSRLVYQDQINLYNTVGLDILLDVHLLRTPMPFEFGFRSMYLTNDNSFRFEFLWSVDFYAVGGLFNSMNNGIRPEY